MCDETGSLVNKARMSSEIIDISPVKDDPRAARVRMVVIHLLFISGPEMSISVPVNRFIIALKCRSSAKRDHKRTDALQHNSLCFYKKK